ncbi:MAG: hypothetical protein R6U38_01440 [Desulfatiglandaceae bacterium]
MASNFRISVHRNSDNLHLKLMGDFDGTSAWELLNILKKHTNSAYRVIIHTSALKNIYPYGRDTFQDHLRQQKEYPVRILFTGEHARQIAPEKNVCL